MRAYVRKERLQSKEDEGGRLQTWSQQGFFTTESALKIYLSSCDLNSFEISIGSLHISFIGEICNMSPTKKISTRVVASL